MMIRSCIAIPTYNNHATLEAVVLGCLSFDLPLLIIDDGSVPPINESILHPSIQDALSKGKIQCLRHSQNLGKGSAIQTAFKFALTQAYTHLLTIDSDGQHPIQEIPKLLNASKEKPWDLIIGSRNLAQATVPNSSRFGRAFSNFWVHFETGQKISDSQSGLRLYPLFLVQTMRFFTRRYDFEIEVLIRLLWKGVNVSEVPVDVLYQEKKERVSHFHKFHDNVRISLLNCLLVVLSLFKLHLSPAKLGLALGLGVLVGTTPFWGFHTAIVFLFALVFQLNAGLLWLGSQISMPPLAPFLVYFSLALGSQVLHTPLPHSLNGFTFEVARTLFTEWLVGSLLLGALLGSLIGFLFYALVKWKKLLQTQSNWTGKMRGGKLGNGFLIYVVKHFGVKSGYFFLYLIVPYFYLFAPKSTRASQEYWLVVAPEIGFWKRQFLVLRHYFNFGKVLMDRVYQQASADNKISSNSQGFTQIASLIQGGKGVILLSAHVGAWDIAARHIYKRGIKDPFHTVEHKPDGVSVSETQGSEKSVQTIFANNQSHAVLDIHRLLSKGQPIGMMGDRPTQARFELVPFFKHLIAVDTSAFRMSATLQVPLVFTFGFRKENYTYDFFAEIPRIYTFDKTKTKEEQCLVWAEEFAHTLEKYVHRYKEQWFNFYPFFSAPPKLMMTHA